MGKNSQELLYYTANVAKYSQSPYMNSAIFVPFWSTIQSIKEPAVKLAPSAAEPRLGPQPRPLFPQVQLGETSKESWLTCAWLHALRT